MATGHRPWCHLYRKHPKCSLITLPPCDTFEVCVRVTSSTNPVVLLNVSPAGSFRPSAKFFDEPSSAQPCSQHIVVVGRSTSSRYSLITGSTRFVLTHLTWLPAEYLSELCFPVKLRPSRYQLRSSQSNKLIVPPVKLPTYGPRSFGVAGPTIWNNLPEYLRDPELSIDNFRGQLKTFLFAQY